MNIALILSGGTGTRLGADIPKQYIKVNDKMILSYCMETLTKHPDIDGIQIVADVKWQEQIRKEFVKQNIVTDKWMGFSTPGISRQGSILSGLKDIKQMLQEDAYILIHDAARPLLSKELISNCLREVAGHDGLMPVLPVKDTMYLMDETGKKIDKLINRDYLVAGQAPEVFVLNKYYELNCSLSEKELNEVHGSTEPAYKAGFDMVLIPGEEINFKVTTPEDLQRFSQIMELSE